jgi:hypothetical protein
MSRVKTLKENLLSPDDNHLKQLHYPKSMDLLL